jgi:hypothetical protein
MAAHATVGGPLIFKWLIMQLRYLVKDYCDMKVVNCKK